MMSRIRTLRNPVCYGALALLLALSACSGDRQVERPGEPAVRKRAAGDSATQAQPEGNSPANAVVEHGAEHGAAAPARVTLSESAVRTAGIKTETVRLEPAAQPVALEVPGQVEFEPRRVALITPRVAGRVERVAVVEGDRVGAGQTVALLFSPVYLTAQQDFVLAHQRAERLRGTPDEPGAHALATAARRRLTVLGVLDPEIDRLARTGEPEPYLALRAPFAGSIMHAGVLSGAAVAIGDSLFRIADLSAVDVVAEVPERALPLVRLRQQATIAIAAYPGMHFTGDVERLRQELNTETRTMQAVVHVPNRDGRLRPGMYATVRLAAPAAAAVAMGNGRAGAADSLITVPERAVVTDGDKRLAFVEVGPRTYERREVEVTSLTPPGSVVPSESFVAVRRGLRPGERAVVSGAFTLKSELAKAALGEHGH